MNRPNENTRIQQIKFDKNKSKTQIQINVKIYKLPLLLFTPFFNQLKNKKPRISRNRVLNDVKKKTKQTYGT